MQIKNILKTDNIENISERLPKLVILSEVQIFHKFIPIEYLQHLASMTTFYASHNGYILNVDKNDIRYIFLNFCYLEDISKYPEKIYTGTPKKIYRFQLFLL